MVCTGTYVHSGDVITIGQALPTSPWTSFTGCVGKGVVEGPKSGGNDRFYEPWNPREISQEALFSLKRSV